MASLLRQLIASPRARHPDSNLDLCYVTPFLIATSGPSGTYPQRAYRNPLDQLVKFLDGAHGEDWCIWEFRAEGTGYPDKEVRGKVKHYPWPDHHPPPFSVVPLVMGGMRKWLNEGETDDLKRHGDDEDHTPKKRDEERSNGRVVVVHCKAGKGRSGTMACSYLISQCGWTKDEALARFTDRRMRPGFGQGVSIPSQLRWVDYVDRWTKAGKVYVEREIEIMEVHVWGLREGVKVGVEGYIEEGKIIKTFHVFGKNERLIVEGGAPGSAGFADMLSDMYQSSPSKQLAGMGLDGSGQSRVDKLKKKMTIPAKPEKASTTYIPPEKDEEKDAEVGGSAVIFRPTEPLIIPTSDISIDFERRNKAGYGMTMVTSVAHVWFNTFFEGNGPEQNGKADQTGVFEIEWDKMDGIKGSLRKGTRALDRLAVVWRVHNPTPDDESGENEIKEPGTDSPVPELAAADWKGVHDVTPTAGKDLGLRTESPHSASVSKASSVRSKLSNNDADEKEEDDDSVKGVKSSGPGGEEEIEVHVNDLPQPTSGASEPSLKDINAGLDTASNTTSQRAGSD